MRFISRFLIISLVFFSSFSNAIERRDIKSFIQKQVKEKTIAQYGFLTEEDIRVIFLNADEDKIDERAQFFVELSGITSFLNRTVIPVFFKDKNDELLQQQQWVIDVEAYGNFLKTTQKIGRGKSLSSTDIEVVREDIYGKPFNSIRQISELKGKESRSTISKGVYLTESILKNESIIDAGDSISVVLQTDNLSLKVKGVAKQAGAKGDKIRVRLDLGSKKILKGEIVDSNTVYIYSNT